MVPEKRWHLKSKRKYLHRTTRYSNRSYKRSVTWVVVSSKNAKWKNNYLFSCPVEIIWWENNSSSFFSMVHQLFPFGVYSLRDVHDRYIVRVSIFLQFLGICLDVQHSQTCCLWRYRDKSFYKYWNFRGTLGFVNLRCSAKTLNLFFSN